MTTPAVSKQGSAEAEGEVDGDEEDAVSGDESEDDVRTEQPVYALLTPCYCQDIEIVMEAPTRSLDFRCDTPPVDC